MSKKAILIITDGIGHNESDSLMHLQMLLHQLMIIYLKMFPIL